MTDGVRCENAAHSEDFSGFSICSEETGYSGFDFRKSEAIHQFRGQT
jgi:hypothetical protein